MKRREFFNKCTWKIMYWTPGLALLGLRFHPYTLGPAAGYSGWITWCGKLVGFVPVK